MKTLSFTSITALVICVIASTGCYSIKSNAKDAETFVQTIEQTNKDEVKDSDKNRLALKGAVKKLEITPGSGGHGLKDVYLFNEQGNILEQSSVYRSDNRSNTKIISQYDKADKKISTEFYKDETLITKSVYEYNAQGKIIEEIKRDAQGKETGRQINKYNERGDLIETIEKLVNSQSIAFGMGAIPAGDYKQVFTYDENGNQNSISSYMPGSDKPIDKRTFVFNQQKQRIEETTASPDYGNEAPRTFRNFYAYNQNNDVKEYRNYESIAESNVKTVRDKFKVIDNKNTVQNGYLVSDKPGMILWTVTTYEYEYDSQGNWTRQTSYTQVRSSDKPVQDRIIERKIQYF